MKRKLLFAMLCIVSALGLRAETDYTSLMSSDWTNSGGNFQTGRERYQTANYNAGDKVMYQSFKAPAAGIYEIKFYAVTSSTSGRGFNNIYGDNIAQAYATAGSNKTTLAMTVVNQTGCTLVADANIRTLSVEAAEGETVEYGLENIATGGNWYTIKGISVKMKTVAEIYQAQYDEAYAIWQHSTENVEGARATFKTYVDAMQTALTGTLAEAQAAAADLEAALTTYENQSYPIKGSGVKYNFTDKMNMAIDAWTCKQGNGPAQYGFTGATETYGNTNAGEVMYQTISGLANGEYEIVFYAVVNAANGGGIAGSSLTYVYANDQKLDIDVIAQSSCTPSDYERKLTVMVKDGTLKYGISNYAAAGNWYLCKNVALYMTGAPDLSDYYEAIEENLAVANGLTASIMNATVLTALQNAISATEGYKDITVTKTLETLNNNLTTAISNANTSISNYEEALNVLQAASTSDEATKAFYAANATVAAIQAAYNNRTLEALTAEQKTECANILKNYAAWQELKAYADALVAVANDNATANNTLASAISDAETYVNNAADAAAITSATATLKEAMVTYAGAANPVGDGVQFDLTFMLTNPDVTEYWDGTWEVRPEGWYNDQTGGNFQVMGNEEMGPGGEVFMEYWSENPRTSGFVLYQKATLPEGTYKMTGRVGLNQNVGGTTANMTFSANETDGTQIAVGVLADQEVEFVNGKEQEVKIGIKAHEGNCYRWIGINKIKLFKVQAKSYEVNEDKAYDNTQAGAGDVELTRTIKEGFNTLVLPFSMTQAEVEANFGAGAVVYTVSSYANDNVTFNVKEGISANEPVILKATQAGTNYTIEGRTIVAGAPVKNGTNVTMTGSYAATFTVPTNAYIINGGKFYLVNSTVTIKGTRAYINVTEPVGGEVKAVLNAVFEDGTETAIENVLGNEAANGAIYNLAGQRVQKAVKGLYIIGGKKVMVK